MMEEKSMSEFASALDAVLPADLPHREQVIAKAARHLELIVEANQYLNLTRITTPREAAIKHVLDSLLPYQLFAGARHIMDIGTGAGYPGLPLAVVYPEQRFTLAESIQKKARFVAGAVDDLQLTNVKVEAKRAEDLLKLTKPDIITARAVAPLDRALTLFALALKAGTRALLYKGPDAAAEISAAQPIARRHGLQMRLACQYELPDALGTRSIVEIRR